MNYARHFSTRQTPQSEPIPGSNQVANSAGGYAFPVDDWTRLERFLILGSEGGSYYADERTLTVANAQSVLNCIKEDGKRAVDVIVDISKSGRAPKNDPALFALAMCGGLGDEETRKYALCHVNDVARIGTHLFKFVEYSKAFRGWGRAYQNAIAHWYNDKEPSRLAYQVVKYQQRGGWSHRDVLRLAKPTPVSESHDAIFKWITKGFSAFNEENLLEDLTWAYEFAKMAKYENEIVDAIQKFRLTWEFIPAKWLKSSSVWEALLPNLPLSALVRNLGRMTANNTLKPMGKNVDIVLSRLEDADYIKKSRLHPLSILVALNTYTSGQGVRGSLSWNPVSQITDALDSAFYKSFGNVKSTGKRLALCLDVSGSMSMGEISGMAGITPRIGSAAMSLITAATEKKYTVVGFSHEMIKLDISPRQRLSDVVNAVSGIPFGRTDCALPMIHALNHDIDVDAFIVYTDSETWCGNIHPVQALQKYRECTGIPAKLIVVGMVSNGFSIADPSDGGMLDVVGFDTSAPNVMADFITG